MYVSNVGEADVVDVKHCLEGGNTRCLWTTKQLGCRITTRLS